jgi:hypothetical protein
VKGPADARPLNATQDVEQCDEHDREGRD